MAIFVAAWREHRVIQSMLDHNVTRLRYPRFDFFVGAYPNDGQTLAAVREAMKRHPNVHLAVCPHDGPTSKADCLNWIYQRMILYEEEHGVHFDMIITHDAEDIIDPDALLVDQLLRAVERHGPDPGAGAAHACCARSCTASIATNSASTSIKT